MNFNEIRNLFKDNYNNLVESVKESANQLFGRTFDISSTLSDESNTIINMSSLDFPRFHISFKSSGKNNLNHILSIEPKFILSLYAWMIGDEPEDSITSEHSEGIQEAISQILGQIQAIFEAEGVSLQIEEMNSIMMESVDPAVTAIEEEEGLTVDYIVKSENTSFKIQHFLWFLSTNETTSSNADEGQNMADSLMENMEQTDDGQVSVNPAEFQNLGPAGSSGGQGSPSNLDMLMEVKLDTVVELGRKTMPIKDVLKLGKGSVIELDKAAGEPLEIFVNGHKLAEGEVVVVDELFGIRITQLVEPRERLKSLTK